MERAKKDYYKKLLDQNIKNSKKVWETLNEMLPSKKSDSVLQIENENEEVLEGIDLSNYIKNFFNKVGSK